MINLQIYICTVRYWVDVLPHQWPQFALYIVQLMAQQNLNPVEKQLFG